MRSPQDSPSSTASTPPRKAWGAETAGLLLGLIGVIAFSLTPPVTRVALQELDPWFVGLGRATAATLPAALWLLYKRAPWPTFSELKLLVQVALGVVVGFPVCVSMGLQTVLSSHSAVVVGTLPLMTALCSAFLGAERERLPPTFWLCALAGSVLVVAFALSQGSNGLSSGDLWLLLGVALGALGYAQGGRLARSMSGDLVISWALVLSIPVLLVPILFLIPRQPFPWHTSTVASFAYLSLVSQWLGFFAWYQGLALGGVARVSQVQLLQIFMTIGLATWFFGENPSAHTWLFALAVTFTVLVGRVARQRGS